MRIKTELEILRKKRWDERPHIESFSYETDDGTETVATALTRLNERIAADKSASGLIRWDCSCLQKKCGACAMLINGKPGLACDARLSAYPGRIRLEPLKKFPVIEDLVVDRSVMLRNLERLKVWLESEADASECQKTAYEASRCLQCGCCLEVCPNFMAEGDFAGMAAAIPASRLIAEQGGDKEKGAGLRRQYGKYIYEGCGKSLACKNICPAGIDTESMLVNSNAVAVWKRLRRPNS